LVAGSATIIATAAAARWVPRRVLLLSIRDCTAMAPRKSAPRRSMPKALSSLERTGQRLRLAKGLFQFFG
jgi:hypothetical protein